MNQFVIVGRVQDFKKEQNTIIVEVPRNYKNENGEYEKDLITIKTTEKLFNNTFEYCNINDCIGVKGRIQNNNTLIAEKVSFLSTRKENEE